LARHPPGPDPKERGRRGLLARLIGTRGERAAVRALRRRGYRVLGRNLRTPAGELDVLAEERGLLVLVEVKTCGSAGASGAPGAQVAWDRIGVAGCRRLEGIGRWLTSQPAFRGRGFRADLVAVTFDAGHPVVTIRPDAL
jgi:putative endonuclease